MAHLTRKMDSALDLLRTRGTLRPRDLEAQGIPGDYLNRLSRRGLAEQVSRGLYAWPGYEVTEHHSLVEAVRLVPKGVVCLLSALQFHGLTTQSPREVWLAIANNAWAPRVAAPRLRIVRYSGRALTEMVEEHVVETFTIKVYSPAKTVADCFKYRNKIGLDVAIEALRDCWKSRKATMSCAPTWSRSDEWKKPCRVRAATTAQPEPEDRRGFSTHAYPLRRRTASLSAFMLGVSRCIRAQRRNALRRLDWGDASADAGSRSPWLRRSRRGPSARSFPPTLLARGSGRWSFLRSGFGHGGSNPRRSGIRRTACPAQLGEDQSSG